jgi:hypothetical protein
MAFVLILAWTFGVSFILGLDVGNGTWPKGWELVLFPIWPVAVPVVKFLHWWQWGKCGFDGPLRRYSYTPWWSRGDKPRG